MFFAFFGKKNKKTQNYQNHRKELEKCVEKAHCNVVPTPTFIPLLILKPQKSVKNTEIPIYCDEQSLNENFPRYRIWYQTTQIYSTFTYPSARKISGHAQSPLNNLQILLTLLP